MSSASRKKMTATERRAQRGVTKETLDHAYDTDKLIKLLRVSTEAKHAAALRLFEEAMTELQKSPERWSYEWQPRTVATPQDLMTPGAPVPSLHIFHYVLEFYVSGSFGHKSEACSVDTAIAIAQRLFSALRRKIGEAIPTETRDSVRTYIRSVLKTKYGMAEKTLSVTPNSSMVNAVSEGLFTDTYRPVLTRFRIQTAYTLCLQVAGLSRIGSILKTSDRGYALDEHLTRAFQYGHQRFFLRKGKDGSRNVLYQEIALMFTKTTEGQGRSFPLHEALPSQSQAWNGPLLFLALALRDGAIIGDPSVQELFDPAAMKGHDELELLVKPEWLEIPVCRGVDYQNGKSIAKLRPMDAGSFNKIIKDLAVTLGYEEGFSSHRLRAFGAQAALNAGVDLTILQYHLHHKLGGSMIKKYMNSTSGIDIMAMAFQQQGAEPHTDHDSTGRTMLGDKIRYDPKAPLALSADGRKVVLEDPDVVKAFGACSDRAAVLSQLHGGMDKLPDAAKEELAKMYECARQIYQRQQRYYIKLERQEHFAKNNTGASFVGVLPSHKPQEGNIRQARAPNPSGSKISSVSSSSEEDCAKTLSLQGAEEGDLALDPSLRDNDITEAFVGLSQCFEDSAIPETLEDEEDGFLDDMPDDAEGFGYNPNHFRSLVEGVDFYQSGTLSQLAPSLAEQLSMQYPEELVDAGSPTRGSLETDGREGSGKSGESSGTSAASGITPEPNIHLQKYVAVTPRSPSTSYSERESRAGSARPFNDPSQGGSPKSVSTSMNVDQNESDQIAVTRGNTLSIYMTTKAQAGSVPQILDFLVNLPEFNSESNGYASNLSPVTRNGQDLCPGCHRVLAELFPTFTKQTLVAIEAAGGDVTKVDPKNVKHVKRKDVLRSRRAHITKCVMRLKLEAERDNLIRIYRLDREAERKVAIKTCPACQSNAQSEGAEEAASEDDQTKNKKPKKKLEKESVIWTAHYNHKHLKDSTSCGCGYAYKIVNEDRLKWWDRNHHLLTVHSINLFHGAVKTIPEDMTKLFSPEYVYSDGQFYLDPLAQEARATRHLRDFLERPNSLVPYTDHDHHLTSQPISTLNDEATTALSPVACSYNLDWSYKGLAENDMYLQEPLCVFCVHDDSLPDYTRMRTFTDLAAVRLHLIAQHILPKIRREANVDYSLEDTSEQGEANGDGDDKDSLSGTNTNAGRPIYIVSGCGDSTSIGLECPDSHCRAHSATAEPETLLISLNHTIIKHGYTLAGWETKMSRKLPILFANSGDVEAVVQSHIDALDVASEKRKASRKGKSENEPAKKKRRHDDSEEPAETMSRQETRPLALDAFPLRDPGSSSAPAKSSSKQVPRNTHSKAPVKAPAKRQPPNVTIIENPYVAGTLYREQEAEVETNEEMDEAEG